MATTFATEYRIGMDYGVGINSVTGEVLGRGIEPGTVETIANAGGMEVSSDLLMINSQEEFQQSLDISTSVNGQYGLFSGNAKFDFSSRIGYQSESTFLVARVVVKNAFTQVLTPRFTPVTTKLIENGQWDRFREQAGDVFVRGFETGGEFYGVIEISSSVRTAQQKISAQLQLKYGMPLAGAKADTSMELETHERQAETRITVNVFQNGGKGDDAISDVDSMLKRYKEFARLVSAENARPIRALMTSYRTLDLPKEPNFIDVQKRIAVLQDRVLDLNETLRLRNEIKFVLQHQNYFESPDIDVLNAVSAKLASVANAISRGASECANDVGKCEFGETVMPAIQLPKRKPDAPVENKSSPAVEVYQVPPNPRDPLIYKHETSGRAHMMIAAIGKK